MHLTRPRRRKLLQPALCDSHPTRIADSVRAVVDQRESPVHVVQYLLRLGKYRFVVEIHTSNLTENAPNSPSASVSRRELAIPARLRSLWLCNYPPIPRDDAEARVIDGGRERGGERLEQGGALAELVGTDLTVPCLGGDELTYRDLDCAASTPATKRVAQRVAETLPWYSSVHRGAGYKSRLSTDLYETSRRQILAFTNRRRRDENVAVLCRNTTEALNHLAFKLVLEPSDVVVTTVVEHHANMLPWARYAQRRWVECERDGTFSVDDVIAALDTSPRPRLLAITGASNVTGWLPPVDAICDEAHDRGIPVVLDAAQLAPHRPIPAPPEFVAFSGHKLYAPYGAGALVGPSDFFNEGEPFLAGGGAVDLVDLDEVIWSAPPEREEAGSPNVLGAVAFGEAISELSTIGWPSLIAHETLLATKLRRGLAGIDGVELLGPDLDTDTLAIATFNVAGLHHALVAARLSAEFAIGVRHGCFCAHPYLMRLLGVGPDAAAQARASVLKGDRSLIPGAVRASCGIGTTLEDVEFLLGAVASIASGDPPPVSYTQDPHTGDFWPDTDLPGWSLAERRGDGGCARG